MRQSDIGVASEEALDGNVEESEDGKIYLWKKLYSFWKHFKKSFRKQYDFTMKSSFNYKKIC